MIADTSITNYRSFDAGGSRFDVALNFDRARDRMVATQLEARGIADVRLLAAQSAKAIDRRSGPAGHA